MSAYYDGLVKSAARAIGMTGLIEEELSQEDIAAMIDWWKPEATVAVDTVLAGLARPSEGMVEAGRWPAEDDGPLACFVAMLGAVKAE